MRPSTWRKAGFGTALDRIIARTKIAPSGCQEISGSLQNGCVQVRVSVDGFVWTMSAHRIVYLAFVDLNLPDDMQVQRKCGNLRCVRIDHLVATKYGCLASDESRSKQLVANKASGRRRRKLTRKQATYIQNRRKKGLPVCHLADKYEVSLGTIYAAAHGETWDIQGG